MNWASLFSLPQICARATQLGALLTFLSIVIAFVIEEVVEKEKIEKYTGRPAKKFILYFQEIGRIITWLSISLFLAYTFLNINWLAGIAMILLCLIVLGLTGTAIIFPCYLKREIRKRKNTELEKAKKDAEEDITALKN